MKLEFTLIKYNTFHFGTHDSDFNLCNYCVYANQNRFRKEFRYSCDTQVVRTSYPNCFLSLQGIPMVRLK
jgi:hypothetical protein